MSNTVLRTTPGPIFLACQAALMAKTGWPAERVIIVDPELFPGHTQAEQYVTLWLAHQTPNMATFEGGGRCDTRYTMEIEATLYTRYAVDEASSDLAWLTDASLGHFAAGTLILDAMIAFQPTDNYATDLTGATGNWLCTEPIKPAPISRPLKRQKRVKGRGDPDWGASRFSFQAVYMPALTQTQQ